jgi:hypothetical protein
MSSARPWFHDAAGASSACMAWIDHSRLGCLLFAVFFSYDDNHQGKPAASRITY